MFAFLKYVNNFLDKKIKLTHIDYYSTRSLFFKLFGLKIIIVVSYLMFYSMKANIVSFIKKIPHKQFYISRVFA